MVGKPFAGAGMVQDEGGFIDDRHWLPHGEELLTRARQARGDTYEVEGGRGGKQKYSREDLLTTYLNYGHIEPHQFRAGDRYFKLWKHSILSVRYVQMRYTELRGTFDPDCLQAVPKEYLEAQAAIRGEAERDVVFSVCCWNSKAGKRGQMGLLRDGLDDLARHFRRQDKAKRRDN